MSDLTDALRAGAPCRKERRPGNDGEDILQDVYGASIIMKEAADKIDQLSSLIEDLKNSEHQKRLALVSAWVRHHNNLDNAMSELAGRQTDWSVVKHWFEKTLTGVRDRQYESLEAAKAALKS